MEAKKKESDETGFGRMIVGSMEDAEDLMRKLSALKILRRILPRAVRAVEFESTGRGNKLVKKTKVHLEAEKNLRGKDGDELKIAKNDQAKKKVQSQKDHARDTDGQEQASCLSSTFV